MHAASTVLAFATLASVCQLRAQRVYQEKEKVVYEDALGQKFSLGVGHSPVPVSDDKILLIRGAQMGYGDRFACTNAEAKNRVALYETRTGRESVIYDKPINNDIVPSDAACIFEQADLSPSGSTL